MPHFFPSDDFYAHFPSHLKCSFLRDAFSMPRSRSTSFVINAQGLHPSLRSPCNYISISMMDYFMSPPLTINSMRKRVVTAFPWHFISSFLWFDIYLTVKMSVFNKRDSALALKRCSGIAVAKAGRWDKTSADVTGVHDFGISRDGWGLPLLQSPGRKAGPDRGAPCPWRWHCGTWNLRVEFELLENDFFRTLRRKDDSTGENRPALVITN